MTNTVNISMSLLYHAVEFGESNAGPHLDAIAIAMMKNFLSQEDLHVGDPLNFARKFKCSLKRLKKAMSCHTGRLLLEYRTDKGGLLHVNKIAGLGYNAPFVVLEDDIMGDTKKLQKKIAVPHTKNIDVKIPIKESEKTDISIIRKKLHIALVTNHLVKSIRAYNTFINDQSCDVSQAKKNVHRYSMTGLYEGVSVKRMVEVSGVSSKRTMERLISEIQGLGLFEAVGRHKRVAECKSQEEAYGQLIRMRQLKKYNKDNQNKSVLYVVGRSVFEKKSNRYQMAVGGNLLPRFHKIISNEKKEEKNKKDMKSWWSPKYGRYEFLHIKYRLIDANYSSKEFSEPDLDPETFKRNGLVFETSSNKNLDILKDKVKKRVAPSTTQGLFDHELRKANKLRKSMEIARAEAAREAEAMRQENLEHPAPTDTAMSEECDGRIDKNMQSEAKVTPEIDSEVDNEATKIDIFEYYQEKRRTLFRSAYDEVRFREEHINPNIKEMAERLGISQEEAYRVRLNTQRRLCSKYSKERKAFMKEYEEENKKRYRENLPPILFMSVEKYISRMFNPHDKKIQDQYPMTYKEYIIDHSKRNRWNKKKTKTVSNTEPTQKDNRSWEDIMNSFVEDTSGRYYADNIEGSGIDRMMECEVR